MKTIAILFFLSACSGGGSGEGQSLVLPASQQDEEVIVAAEIQIPNDIKEELMHQPQYQIGVDEIELLYSEGAITEEQKQELMALLQLR